jgi:pimeloyl-ACP methyl ester carboxylesterase
MTTHRIEMTDGTSLHVEEDGSGPPLFLVNGAFCTVRQWDRVVPALARDHRVIRHDVRGSGASTKADDDSYRFERYVADILEIADALDIHGEVSIWGMAWGARVALWSAAEHADRFTRLVLSDLGIDPADVKAQRAGGTTAREALAKAGIELPPLPKGWNTHADFEAAKKAMAATLLHADLMPWVERVTCPTLIATGEHDPNIVSSRRALTGFADARLEVLPLTGHGSVLMRPDLTCDVVASFLKEARR